jgi:uncharacterized protein (DUF1800 family)
MAIAQTSRKRKKKRKKKRPAAQSPPPVTPPQATPPSTPSPPSPPATYRWLTGWDDSRHDGLVRAIDDGEDHSTPQDPATIPPRPLPQAQNPAAPVPPQPFGTYSGPFGRVQAKRLLDRAGFGPLPGQAEGLAENSLQDAVHQLTRPSGDATLVGPAPTDQDGNPIAPADFWGHDHLWWLDRMVRSNQSLVERIALVLHDWFATSNAGVSHQQQMIDQSWLFRTGGLGSFLDLAINVTRDPAMLQWLNGNENRRNGLNENYARELMELFTLGADRGAYTENDIREAARGLTGWRNDWSSELGSHNFRFDPNRHDNNNKTIFGRTGNWNWDDVPRLCLENPLHASFFVEKLWSYFIPQPPSADTRDALVSLYTSSSYAIRPVLEAILMHPDFYLGPPTIKPPVVHLASMLRALGRHIDTDYWTWLSDLAGQFLFWPPNVSGWDDDRWLDTSRMRARWLVSTYALENTYFDPWNGPDYDPNEAADRALDNALATWDYPPLRVEQQDELLRFSNNAWTEPIASWQRSPYRAMRHNALQQLIAISPDLILS